MEWFLTAGGHVGIFLAALALDLLWACWTRSVVAGHRLQATTVTGCYYLVATGVTLCFARQAEFIPAVVLGHMAGTWLAVRPQVSSPASRKEDVTWQASERTSTPEFRPAFLKRLEKPCG